MHFIKVVSIVSVIICLGLLYNHFGSTKTGEDHEIGGEYSYPSSQWSNWVRDLISVVQGVGLSLDIAKAITDCSDDSCLRGLQTTYTMQRLIEACIESETIDDQSLKEQCLKDLFPPNKKFIGFTAENDYPVGDDDDELCESTEISGLQVRKYITSNWGVRETHFYIVFMWGVNGCYTKTQIWYCSPDYGAATVASHDLRIPCQYDSRKHFKAHDSRNYIKADTNQLSIE
eukprot:471786_1